MPTYTDMMLQMYLNPPDLSGPIPLENYKSTMYGATIPFNVIAWLAVFARLWTRYRIVKDVWWDDHVVLLAAAVNLVSMIAFLRSADHGMGKHILTLTPDMITEFFKMNYVQSGGYYTTTALVKIALLLQYLRTFKNGAMRHLTVVLLILTTLWGAAWTFMAWFPCFPVSGFWNRGKPANCYMLGFGSIEGSARAFTAFAGSNMFLDTIIFIVPLAMYFRTSLRVKELMAVISLFTLGSVVLIMAALRLWTAVKHNMNFADTYDFTWWYPLTSIIACIEIDFAIICASVPIFWPVVMHSLNEIFVTKDFNVTHHVVVDVPATPSTPSTSDFEMRQRGLSSASSWSQLGLTKGMDSGYEGYETGVPKTDYTNELVRQHVVGLEAKTEVVVQVARPTTAHRPDTAHSTKKSLGWSSIA